jgi:hypothetical protein
VTEPRGSLADRRAFALALIALFGLAYVALAYFAFDGFPFSGDEYSASLQGELFARGVLHAPAQPHAEWLRVDHVFVEELVRSKYPPGGPALLAIGARFGVAWLVTPVVAVAALVVAWWGMRRALGVRAALAGTIALAAAPMFAFEAGTFYSHVPALCALACAFTCVAGWTRDRRDVWLVGAGLAIGCAFTIRPFDALLFGVAMVALRSPRAIVVTAASALPLVAVVLVYQDAQFGSPLRDGFTAYAPQVAALYGDELARYGQISPHYLVDAIQQWNHLDILRAFVIDWTVPGAVVVAIVGARAIGRDHPARGVRDFALALVITYVAVLFLTSADHDDGARPRYLSIVLLPVAVLVAAGFAPASEAVAAKLGRRVRTALVATALSLALVQLAAIVIDRLPKQWQREGLYREVAAKLVPSDAVVIVRAQYPTRYARNGPFFDGILYLSAPAKTSIADVAAAYPHRPIFEAREPRENEPWLVERVR